MSPNFRHGDYLLANSLAYVSSVPRRGDVVVLRTPFDSGKEYVKRIIGLPGEHLRIEGERVIIDGRMLDEPYVDAVSEKPVTPGNQWILEDGQYFVMGDNRQVSMDSRYFWPVDRSFIRGKVWFRYWPLGRLGLVKAQRPCFRTSQV